MQNVPTLSSLVEEIHILVDIIRRSKGLPPWEWKKKAPKEFVALKCKKCGLNIHKNRCKEIDILIRKVKENASK